MRLGQDTASAFNKWDTRSSFVVCLPVPPLSHQRNLGVHHLETQALVITL